MVSLIYCEQCQSAQRFEVIYHAIEQYMVDGYDEEAGYDLGVLIESKLGNIDRFVCSTCGRTIVGDDGEPIDSWEGIRPLVILAGDPVNNTWDGIYHPAMRR
jgi:hypothetical protein